MEEQIRRKTVETQEGTVIGRSIQGITVFRGIPYAAPPLGRLRFREPEAPSHRSEPLEAFQFGPICPQTDVLGPVPGFMNEDCLYLNIWAPDTCSPATISKAQTTIIS